MIGFEHSIVSESNDRLYKLSMEELLVETLSEISTVDLVEELFTH